MLAAFEQSAYFKIVQNTDDLQTLHRALDKGKAQAGLVVPPHFAADVLKGRTAQVQLLIDGTDSTPANVAMNASQAVVTHFMQTEKLVPATVLPFDFRPRLWYNPDLKSTYFMLPGLIALVLHLIVPMITANAIVREKEQGNIEQLLVTPIKPYELIIGKILPYIGIGVVIATSIVLAMHFIFSVPIRGSLVTLFFLTMIYLVVCLGIGLWASTIAQSQQQASQIVMFFAMPSILLSGFIFPRETMPVFIHHLGNFKNQGEYPFIYRT